LTAAEKKLLKKKKRDKKDFLAEHYHLDEIIKEKGFEKLFSKVVIGQNKSLEWKGPFGHTTIDVLETYMKPPEFADEGERLAKF
jgi:hypothetical protein